MSEGNIGVLLHKLTKYQTLLANTNASDKISVYTQKINEYQNKLERLGVNHSTLNQMGGLVGGDKYSDTLKGLIDLQTQKIKAKISALGSNTPPDTTGLDAKVDQVTTSINTATTKYNSTIESL